MDIQELLAHLGKDVEAIDAAMREDLALIEDPLLKEIIEYVIFSGGKRIRPLLVVLAARACGLAAPVHKVSSAFEYLHVATLLHDDVIDHADQRRGRPAAKAIWGETAAILAGDYLHARSLHIAGSTGNKECLEILCKAIAAMVEGEFLQLRNANNLGLTEEDYFRILRGKTGVLISAACEVGAVLAGAPQAEVEAMRTYGMNLGLAFQIVDDLLDYHGDPQETGKAVGNDFVEGKITLPLLHALTKAPSADRQFVHTLLAAPAADRAREKARVCALIETLGGSSYARARAEQLVQAATKSLEPISAGLATDLLIGLALYVLNRKK